MALFCTCTRAVDVREGYVARPVTNKLWVHSPCGKPARMVFEKVTFNRQPRNATEFLSYHARKDGMHELTFATVTGEKKVILVAVPYDRRPHTMGINPNDILLNTWTHLDGAIKSIKETNNAMDMSYQKARARALCDVLSLMMPPFFNTADEVGHEALRRYDNRDNPEYETPGLGAQSLAQFDPMLKNEKPLPSPRTGNSIPTEAMINVRRGLDTKMFTLAHIAAMYEMSQQEVKEQLGLV